MGSEKAVIGIDFGTLSGRAAIFRVRDGALLADDVMQYPSGVLETLPEGGTVPLEFALQNAKDYEEILIRTIRKAVLRAGIDAEDIAGIGLDATSSTFVPLDGSGRPLSENPAFSGNPHAYLKLWKHHGAQEQADRLTALAVARKEAFLQRAGGVINAEWMLPKLLEIYEEAPDVYEATDRFTEIADWLVERLTGNVTRGIQHAGYKMLYSEADGGPSSEYMEAAAAGFSSVFRKLKGQLLKTGKLAGTLSAEMAIKLGLNSGIAVASSLIDAHVAAPAAGVTEAGEALLILGTSCCMVVLSGEEKAVPGISGCVKDAVLPGYYAYEAGQSAVGDMFAWFSKNAVNRELFTGTEDEGISVQEALTNHAAALSAGESGLLALDWWNGNRSCLADAKLSGLILGFRLSTKPWEIYRALLESSAFGTRRILDEFKKAGVSINKVRALGGIVGKNPLFMQIYADVLKQSIYAGSTPYGSALGAAIYAAVAAGRVNGWYDDLSEAIGHMSDRDYRVYTPDPAESDVYDLLYKEYCQLYDYFGKGGNEVMHRMEELLSGRTSL